jgi:hypothetical protein
MNHVEVTAGLDVPVNFDAPMVDIHTLLGASTLQDSVKTEVHYALMRLVDAYGNALNIQDNIDDGIEVKDIQYRVELLQANIDNAIKAIRVAIAQTTNDLYTR